jgi:hypothetical protein
MMGVWRTEFKTKGVNMRSQTGFNFDKGLDLYIDVRASKTKSPLMSIYSPRPQ